MKSGKLIHSFEQFMEELRDRSDVQMSQREMNAAYGKWIGGMKTFMAAARPQLTEMLNMTAEGIRLEIGDYKLQKQKEMSSLITFLETPGLFLLHEVALFVEALMGDKAFPQICVCAIANTLLRFLTSPSLSLNYYRCYLEEYERLYAIVIEHIKDPIFVPTVEPQPIPPPETDFVSSSTPIVEDYSKRWRNVEIVGIHDSPASIYPRRISLQVGLGEHPKRVHSCFYDDQNCLSHWIRGYSHFRREMFVVFKNWLDALLDKSVIVWDSGGITYVLGFHSSKWFTTHCGRMGAWHVVRSDVYRDTTYDMRDKQNESDVGPSLTVEETIAIFTRDLEELSCLWLETSEEKQAYQGIEFY